MRLVVLGVLEEDLVHVGGGVLVQLVGGAEDDEGDLAVAQHRQLVRLLHHAELALVERDLDIQRNRAGINIECLPRDEREKKKVPPAKSLPPIGVRGSSRVLSLFFSFFPPTKESNIAQASFAI